MRLQTTQPTETSALGLTRDRLLTEADLANRWKIPQKTLRNWRCLRKGPPWIQIGAGHVRYRPADIEAYEAAKLIREAGQ